VSTLDWDFKKLRKRNRMMRGSAGEFPEDFGGGFHSSTLEDDSLKAACSFCRTGNEYSH